MLPPPQHWTPGVRIQQFSVWPESSMPFSIHDNVDHPISLYAAWQGDSPDPGTSPAPYRLYNIGNNNPVKLLDFIAAIEQALGKQAMKSMMPIQPGDVAATYANIDDLERDVGTPTRRGDGHADLKYVFAAAAEIAEHLQGYTVVVDKSTVPVGTAREVQRVMRKTNPDADFDVASNPEFLREGSAITDFMRPERVVIGVESEQAESLLRELYRPLNLIEAPFTSLESAELIKYAPTLSWPPRSALSSRCRNCAKKPARMCSQWPGVWCMGLAGHPCRTRDPPFRLPAANRR
jgi:hypothetical protein